MKAETFKNGKNIYQNGHFCGREFLKAEEPVNGFFEVELPKSEGFINDFGTFSFRDGIAKAIVPFHVNYKLKIKKS